MKPMESIINYGFAVILLCAVQGCGSLTDVGDGVERGFKDVGKSVGQSVEKAGESFREGIEQASKNFDPVQVGALLKQNAALRDQVQHLVETLAPLGVAVRPIDEPMMRVGDCRGLSRIQVSMDEDDNWIVDETVSRSGTLVLDVIALENELRGFLNAQWTGTPEKSPGEQNNEAFCKALTGASLNDGANRMANRVRGLVDAHVSGFKNADLEPISLRAKAKRVGEHKIRVQVTPLEEDSGNWSIRVKFTLNRGGKGQEELIGSYSKDKLRDKDPQVVMGSPLPLREFVLILN